MKRYIKDGQIKTRSQIVIKSQRTIKDKDGNDKVVGTYTYNPSEEMILADGWMEYIAPEPRPIPERVLVERAKRVKLDELHKFDESNEVNDCIIVYNEQELHYWADKSERDNLKGAIRDCIAVGRTSYRLDLRDKGLSILLDCNLLLSMLSALEVYAIDCYNKTTDHEYAIKSLTTLDEIEGYDFTIGYPEKLRLELQ